VHFHTNIRGIQYGNSNTNDHEAFQLGTGNDLGIS